MSSCSNPSSPPAPASRSAVHHRGRGWARLNALRKRTPLNPYWIELRWLRKAAELLAPHARGLLLDVGGGERPYGALFAPHVQRYLGLEYPPVADNLVPEIWGMAGRLRGIVDVWGDGRQLPFRAGSFDTLLSFEVLEHVAAPERCVLEFARVLKDGGVLLLTVPLAAPLHQLPFDFQRFTSIGIRELLERHGFAVERLESRGNFASATGAVLSHWLLRALAARAQHHDGSVSVSRWRAPLVFPLIALAQLFFAAAERLSRDTSFCLGYVVVARKLARAPAGAMRASSASSGASTASQS